MSDAIWVCDFDRHAPAVWGSTYHHSWADAARYAAGIWERHGLRVHLRRRRL